MSAATPAIYPSDLLDLAIVSDPQIAPDGSHVLFTRATYDADSNETRTAIWRVAENGDPAPFTAGKHDGGARFSPDGRWVAFVAERGEGKRIYRMPTAGGEAVAISPAYDEVGQIAWAPGSEQIAYIASAGHDAGSARIAVDAVTQARHIRMLPFKSDERGLLDGIRRHLFTLPAGGGEARQLTHGDFEPATPSWSPEGTLIAFSAAIDLPEHSFASDIYTIDLAGATLTRLTHGNGPMMLPSYSRDGREIAFLGHEHGDDAGGRYNFELLCVPAGGGPLRSLSAPVDYPVIDEIVSDLKAGFAGVAPLWSHDDGELFVLLSVEGTCAIAAFTRDGHAHRIVCGGDREISRFSLSDGGTLAFTYSTPVIPGDVAIFARGMERRLTNINADWLAAHPVRAPKRLRPRADDGVSLDVWLIEPDASVPRPYPLVLEVHGGPHVAYGCAFFLEFQVLASLGFGVAYGNIRGSQSYGAAFANGIEGDWGGRDVRDVLTNLDAVERAGAVDRRRIGVGGGSYGGFMTSWLAASSDRFAAAVSMRAVNEFVSEVGASDLGWFLERELAAPWSDGGRKLFEGSPMRLAHQIQAPFLVMHSERDYRCPIDQGEQMFTLLRRLGKTAEFVRFTGNGHDLSRSGSPRNRILRLRAIAHWFIRHLRPAGIELPADCAGALLAPLPGERPDPDPADKAAG